MRRIILLVMSLAAVLAFRAAPAAPIGFDDLYDGVAVGDSYAPLGIHFGHATVLGAGISLNEFEFPPRSGFNVAFDDSGPMLMAFDAPMRSFGAYFTYQTKLHLWAYDAADVLVGELSSAFDSNLALSGDPGSLPNEWLGFDGWNGVSRIVIAGDASGGSFVIDDVDFSVPEPSAGALAALALALLAAPRRRHAAGLLVAFAALGSAAGARAQDVSRPVVEPAVMIATAAGIPAAITVSASVADPAGTLLPDSVNLLHVRPDGRTEIVGRLNDAGVDGDEAAGDGIYGARFSSASYPFNQYGGASGLVALRVSAAYRGVLLRKLSPTAALELVDPGLPDDIRPSDIARAVWDSSRQREIIGNEVLFMAAPGTPAAVLHQTAAAVGGRLVGLLPGADVNTWQVEVDCTSAVCVQQWIDLLESRPGLHGAAANTVGALAGVAKPSDPRFDDQYALASVDARKAWAISTGAHPHFPAAVPGRRIAIVDTGIDDKHPEFKDKLVLGKNYAVNPPTRQPTDNHGHGTHVAGIAAAAADNGEGIAGACWTCTIVAVKVLDGGEDPTLRTTALQVAAGIRDAVSRRAQVINLSLQHFDRNEDIARQIHLAHRAGALIVVAAGNDGKHDRSYPGAFEDTEVFAHRLVVHTYEPHLVTVGATDATRRRAAFSNYGTWVELYAPGAAIVSTLPGAAYGELAGTSMAAPLVSGVAAVMSSGRAAFDPHAVTTALLSSTRDTGNDDPDGNRIHELDAFGAVFQGLAVACTKCPEAPDVLLAGTGVLMGQGVAGAQAKSVHGVSVPLRPAGPNRRYVVDFSYDLLTFDAYVRSVGPDTGYFDAFSIGTATAPYHFFRLADPLAARADFMPAFVFGGTARGGNVRVGPARLALPIAAHGPDYLYVVLDTATAPDSDRANWSGGTFRILDVTPE